MDDVLYKKGMTCPVCEKEFKTTKIKHSMLKYVGSDTDLFRHYEGGNPYLYEINVCPNCGFSFSDNFSQRLSTSQIANFLKSVSKQWKKQDYCSERSINEAVETYKLALLSGQVVELKEGSIAGICMRLSWLNRMIGNLDEEMRFMKAEVGLLKKVYEIEGIGDESISPEILVYLLGELNYRLGNFEDSKRWFGIAISKYAGSRNVKKQTADMIKDRWMEIKDKMK